MDTGRDVALLGTAIDAATVTDDFVRGVIGVGEGRIGDDNQQHSWLQRVFRGRVGQRSIVRGMAGVYAGEQLRKAAAEAEQLVRAVHDLASAATPPALDAYRELMSLRIDELPDHLRHPRLTSRSEELRDVHARLSRTVGVLADARGRVVLAEMRNRRDHR